MSESVTWAVMNSQMKKKKVSKICIKNFHFVDIFIIMKGVWERIAEVEYILILELYLLRECERMTVASFLSGFFLYLADFLEREGDNRRQ